MAALLRRSSAASSSAAVWPRPMPEETSPPSKGTLMLVPSSLPHTSREPSSGARQFSSATPSTSAPATSARPRAASIHSCRSV